MNDIYKIIKSLEDSGVLTDGVTEIVKHKINNMKADFLELCCTFVAPWKFLAPLAESKVQPVISSVVKGIRRREFRRTGIGYVNKNF